MEELLKQIELLKKEIASMKQSKSLPVGIVEAFAMHEPPMGWVVCNGQELRIDDYQELYNAIGNVFNEDNTPEGFFCVPDMQGRFIRGWDEDGNVDPERQFGGCQEDALQGHKHCVKGMYTGEDGKHSHRVYYTVYKVGSNVFDDDRRVYEVSGVYDSSHSYGGDPGTNYSGIHQHYLPDHFADQIIDSSYNKVKIANETRPKNIALLYCIKAK